MLRRPYADVVIQHIIVAIMAPMRWAVVAMAALAAVLLFHIGHSCMGEIPATLRTICRVPHASIGWAMHNSFNRGQPAWSPLHADNRRH